MREAIFNFFIWKRKLSIL